MSKCDGFFLGMSNQYNYVINLIGNGIRYWFFSPTLQEYELMQKYKEMNKRSWSELFFDFDFLKQLNRTHWSELGNQERKGFLLLPNNLIEIRKKNKILEKMSSIELISQNAIFPLYQTSNHLMKFNTLDKFLIIQHEKGLIEKYEIETEKLDLNQLVFDITSSPNDNLVPYHLARLNYLEKKLESRLDDTLITRLSAFEIN
jgi:hypothetical protein